MNTKQSILLVEDELPAALALSNVLKDEGFEVFTAVNGEEGLMMALEHHPDMILADLKMPKMGGMEMIRELRKDAWGKDAEVIILTNASEVQLIEEAMSHNAFHYLIKGDSSMAEVIAKIRARLTDTASKGRE